MNQVAEFFQVTVQTLFQEVSIPVWVIVLFSIVLLVLVFRMMFSSRKSVIGNRLQENLHLDAYKIQPITAELENTASEHEELVIKILARADGQPVLLEKLSNQMNASRLRASQVLDSMQKQGSIQVEHGYNQATCYTLTSMGRDIAIAKGYA